MRILAWAFMICGLFVVPNMGVAQSAATLIADRLFIENDRALVATGNVEAFFGTAKLKAKTIRFDRISGELKIEGPITLEDGDDISIMASAAELDRKLQSGILTGARMVLNQQLKLSATTISRREARYNELYEASATSCNTCNNGEAPLWQIRAKRVTHDQVENQLYFEQARLLIRDIPVLYIPRLRLPDPSMKRASGFLIPSLKTTSQLGTGIKVPYFIAMGPHRDVTLTPYVSVRTQTLEFRYRQAYRKGEIELNGAVTRDDERSGKVRAYLFGTGQFELPHDYKLDFGIESASDDSYLTEYGYSSKDRLSNKIGISRAQRDQYVNGSVLNFKSLRDGEVNATLPTLVIDGAFERRYFPQYAGGELRLGMNAHGHYRASDADIIGRDINRLNGDVDWLKSYMLTNGLVISAQTGAGFDVFNIAQDSTFATTQSNATARTGLTFRFPMTRQKQNAAEHLEPILQLGWAQKTGALVPNEESTRTEFDEGNLISLSRFTQADRRENGGVAALGVNWTRQHIDGGRMAFSLGQVFRSTTDTDFTRSSGLTGTTSDLLLAGQLQYPGGLDLSFRSLLDQKFDFTKTELRANWRLDRASIGGHYLWLTNDTAENRPDDISEFNIAGTFDVSRHWTARADWRFDTADDRSATAGLGFTYNNECVSVDLSVDRSYTASTSIEPSTNLGFTVGLRGFSARTGTKRYERTCRK